MLTQQELQTLVKNSLPEEYKFDFNLSYANNCYGVQFTKICDNPIFPKYTVVQAVANVKDNSLKFNLELASRDMSYTTIKHSLTVRDIKPGFTPAELQKLQETLQKFVFMRTMKTHEEWIKGMQEHPDWFDGTRPSDFFSGCPCWKHWPYGEAGLEDPEGPEQEPEFDDI